MKKKHDSFVSINSITKMMKGFKTIKATQARLQEENIILLVKRENIKKVLLKYEHMIPKLGQYEVENIQLREEYKVRKA